MSYEERKSSRHFRSTLDIGMGIFYVIVGGYVVIEKSFGPMKIPPVLAYILGGMMIIGGCARLYRGIKAVLPQKNGTHPPASE